MNLNNDTDPFDDEDYGRYDYFPGTPYSDYFDEVPKESKVLARDVVRKCATKAIEKRMFFLVHFRYVESHEELLVAMTTDCNISLNSWILKVCRDLEYADDSKPRKEVAVVSKIDILRTPIRKIDEWIESFYKAAPV